MTQRPNTVTPERDHPSTCLEAWTQTAQSAIELVWTELYRHPLQLAQTWTLGALQIQTQCVHHWAALLHSGLFEPERIGDLYSEYAQLTDQICEDQLQACNRLVELAQAVPGVPLQRLQEVTFHHYLALFKESPLGVLTGATPQPTQTRGTAHDTGRREDKAA